MSQILDALNKAEQNRKKAQQTESDNDNYQLLFKSERPTQLTQSKKIWPIGLVIAASAVSIAIGYYYINFSLLPANEPSVNITEKANNNENSENVSLTVAENHAVSTSTSLENEAAPTASENLQLTTVDGSDKIVQTNSDLAENNAESIPENVPQKRLNELLADKSKNVTAESVSYKTNDTQKETIKAELATLKPISEQSGRPDKLAVSANSTELVALTAIEKPPSNNNQDSKLKVKSRSTTVTEKPAVDVNSHGSQQNDQQSGIQKDQINTNDNPDTKNIPNEPAWKQSFTINALVYDSVPTKRFALINGSKLYEGAVIPNSDNRLIRILPDGVIIETAKGEILVGTN